MIQYSRILKCLIVVAFIFDAAAQTCPLSGHSPKSFQKGATNDHWWSQALNLKILHQHSLKSNPMSASFNYKREFSKLDLNALKADMMAVLKDSKAYWPADYGR